MRRTRLWILGALGVLVVAAVAGYLVWDNQSPPRLADEPGLYRIQPEETPHGGLRPARLLSFHGKSVVVAFGGTGKKDGTLTATMLIDVPPGKGRYRSYREHESVEVGGLRVTVAAIHDEPKESHEAVDVRLSDPR